MSEPRPPHTDAEIAQQLAEIQARLAELATGVDPAAVAAELSSIRASLRELAKDNEEVRRRLGASLGLRIDDDQV